MTEDEARADLKAKVREKLEELVAFGLAKLDALDRSGAGIVQDHLANQGNYKTPMNFMAALGAEIRGNFQPLHPTKDDRETINNYHLMM